MFNGKIFNKLKGDQGEAKAVAYLKQNKYKIIQTNYKNNIGEIDIICKDKKIWVFVEVKYRSSDVFGIPAEAVNLKKQSKIINIAKIFISQNKLEDCEVRFDVIDILDNQINHIKSAF